MHLVDVVFHDHRFDFNVVGVPYNLGSSTHFGHARDLVVHEQTTVVLVVGFVQSICIDVGGLQDKK